MTDEEMIAEARRWLAALNRPSVLMEQWCHALLRALDAATARAEAAEQKAAEMGRERDEALDTAAVMSAELMGMPYDVTALRARLTLAERVVEALREGWPGAIEAWCLVDPPCGTCRACSLAKSLAAYDAHAKGGGT